jgi:beta-lactamase class A
MKGALLMFLLTMAWAAEGQRTDKRLYKKVNALLDGFHGEVGVYIKEFRKNKTVAIHADTLFPTASMIKVPILLGIMDKIEKGELGYHQEFIYRDSLLYPGSDILGSFKSNERVELSKLLLLMLSTSDNTAALWLQSLSGTGKRINELLDSFHFLQTRVNSRTPGREGNRQQLGWGQTTPFEMATLMEKIYRRELISKTASQKMLRLLGRNYWDEQALSQIPPDVFVASKNGAVDDSRSEVLLVAAPKHPYVFCICTKNNQDKGWNDANEAWVLAKKLSKLLWEYFH